MIVKFWGQKATIRPQNIGLKAAAAKRPHFAHGCLRPTLDKIGNFITTIEHHHTDHRQVLSIKCELSGFRFRVRHVYIYAY